MATLRFLSFLRLMTLSGFLLGLMSMVPGMGTPGTDTDPHPVAFDAQHRDRDPFTGWGFNDEGFAGAAGEDEHGDFLLP